MLKRYRYKMEDIKMEDIHNSNDDDEKKVKDSFYNRNFSAFIVGILLGAFLIVTNVDLNFAEEKVLVEVEEEKVTMPLVSTSTISENKDIEDHIQRKDKQLIQFAIAGMIYLCPYDLK